MSSSDEDDEEAQDERSRSFETLIGQLDSNKRPRRRSESIKQVSHLNQMKQHIPRLLLLRHHHPPTSEQTLSTISFLVRLLRNQQSTCSLPISAGTHLMSL